MIEFHTPMTAEEVIKASAVGGDNVVLDKANSEFHLHMLTLCEDWNENVHVDGFDFAAHYWGQDEEGDGWEIFVIEMKVA